MSILHRRLLSQGGGGPDYHPHGTAATPMTMPLQMVTYAADTVLYGTAHPLITADGGVVPASANVTYPPTIPAGRP